MKQLFPVAIAIITTLTITIAIILNKKKNSEVSRSDRRMMLFLTSFGVLILIISLIFLVGN